MINFKPELVKLLKSINENVSESYPSDWAKLPILIYEEENNTPYTTTTTGESMTSLRYRIEIYSNESTSALKTQINAKLVGRGFTRIFAQDMNDMAGRRHSVLRYEGVIDLENNKIYRN